MTDGIKNKTTLAKALTKMATTPGAYDLTISLGIVGAVSDLVNDANLLYSIKSSHEMITYLAWLEYK